MYGDSPEAALAKTAPYCEEVPFSRLASSTFAHTATSPGSYHSQPAWTVHSASQLSATVQLPTSGTSSHSNGMQNPVASVGSGRGKGKGKQSAGGKNGNSKGQGRFGRGRGGAKGNTKGNGKRQARAKGKGKHQTNGTQPSPEAVLHQSAPAGFPGPSLLADALPPIPDGVTTLSVRRIPIGCTTQQLVGLWPPEQSYNFLHLPYSRRKHRAVGYAFVNFTSRAAMLQFRARWHGVVLSSISPDLDIHVRNKGLDIGVAEVQGFHANLVHMWLRRWTPGKFADAEYMPVVILPDGTRADFASVIDSMESQERLPQGLEACDDIMDLLRGPGTIPPGTVFPGAPSGSTAAPSHLQSLGSREEPQYLQYPFFEHFGNRDGSL